MVSTLSAETHIIRPGQLSSLPRANRTRLTEVGEKVVKAKQLPGGHFPIELFGVCASVDAVETVGGWTEICRRSRCPDVMFWSAVMTHATARDSNGAFECCRFWEVERSLHRVFG